jgi:hypothetical protein
MAFDEGCKREGAPERSAKIGEGALACVEENWPGWSRFLLQIAAAPPLCGDGLAGTMTAGLDAPSLPLTRGHRGILPTSRAAGDGRSGSRFHQASTGGRFLPRLTYSTTTALPRSGVLPSAKIGAGIARLAP